MAEDVTVTLSDAIVAGFDFARANLIGQAGKTNQEMAQAAIEAGAAPFTNRSRESEEASWIAKLRVAKTNAPDVVAAVEAVKV